MINRWLCRGIAGDSVILKITAKAQMTLKITSEADTAHNAIAYSTDTCFDYYVEGKASDGSLQRRLLKRKWVEVKAPADTYAATVTLDSGDSFLFVYTNPFSSVKNAYRWLHLSVQNTYSDALHVNFDAEKALEEKRRELGSALKDEIKKAIEKGLSKEKAKQLQALSQDIDRRLARAQNDEKISAATENVRAAIDAASDVTDASLELSRAILDNISKLEKITDGADMTKIPEKLAEEIDSLTFACQAELSSAKSVRRANYVFSVYQNRIRNILRACGV